MHRLRAFLDGTGNDVAGWVAAALLVLATVLLLGHFRSPASQPKPQRTVAAPPAAGAGMQKASHQKKTKGAKAVAKPAPRRSLRIVYASTTGTARQFARSLQREVFALNVQSIGFDVSLVEFGEYDQDNLEQEDCIVFLLPTWTGGKPSPSAAVFHGWVEDMQNDFRVQRSWLKQIHYAVCGLGNSEYGDEWCLAAKQLDGWLADVGGQPIVARMDGDDSRDQIKQFQQWQRQCIAALVRLHDEDAAATRRARLAAEEAEARAEEGRARARVRKARRAAAQAAADQEQDPEDALNVRLLQEEDQFYEAAVGRVAEAVPSDSEEEGEEEAEAAGGAGVAAAGAGLVDVEDLGGEVQRGLAARADEERRAKLGQPRAMVTPAQRKALTKEGYKILGTHSAVKLCRWTKHQLRGRGGCYKHTCYGITSYQCMETTPSLACANKCVFCWRHHRNPVGREWRWQIDPPEEIAASAIERHQGMIKAMKGVPGVQPHRLAEAMTPRHCALSLVGEPIMYPHINEFNKYLHDRQISTFLVTNAQFPDEIATLDPVTQLYVSIDAGTKESLRRVDRPLFRDFWERFLASLERLRDKGQRTVYRLTLVKSFNMQEIDEYAALVERGQPDFIEVKSVTYCGKSDASDLTIKNVPFHEEVVAFCSALVERLEVRRQAREAGQSPPPEPPAEAAAAAAAAADEREPDPKARRAAEQTGARADVEVGAPPAASASYALACEHAHSNLCLVAHRRFFVDDRWHTWIDYPRFHELMDRFYASGGEETFSSLDYMAPTPEWAVFGAEERGFDPAETRFRRTRAGGVTAIPYTPSGSGCG